MKKAYEMKKANGEDESLLYFSFIFGIYNVISKGCQLDTPPREEDRFLEFGRELDTPRY